MKKFFLSYILWGTAMTLAVLFFYSSETVIEPLELKFYDFRAQISAQTVSQNEIAIIEINDESIAKLGRWPWPRKLPAQMITLLSSATAKPAVIGLNILFSEPEQSGNLELADNLERKYTELLAAKKIKETTRQSEFLLTLAETKKELDNDAKLAGAVAGGGNILLPLYFNFKAEEALTKPRVEPDWLKKYSPTISLAAGNAENGQEASEYTTPLDILASSAAGIGHINVFNDTDGAVRKEYPFIPYNQHFYPSFALEAARLYLKTEPIQTVLTPGAQFTLGKRTIKLNTDSAMLINFNKSKASFKYYSFYDVLNGKIVPEAFKDKIVLIGLTAQGIGSQYVSPVEKNMPTVELSANIIENLLNGRFIMQPVWHSKAELGLILFAGIFITFILPRLKAGIGAALAAIMLIALGGTGIYLFTDRGLWVKTVYPAFLLTAGYIFIVSRKFFSTEKNKELIEVSAIETNKMLGLSFQGQGMLDLAFEKFRNCPVDNPMKELLYNLALDFERKRQFNKAAAVYGHIAVKDPAYKDIKDKIELLNKAAVNPVFSGKIGGAGAEATLLNPNSTTIPTLGRYEITKELGKGAMGIVYLGRDPKINRTVAIKTLRFEEGMAEKELKDMKDRFFREAQAAGNLSHPNIVKIYDAGEEQEIAYMAMELLKGDDLKAKTVKENLLPVVQTLKHIATAAEALDYAHKNGVVHRDIKPANLMLLEDGTLRVADFGIARIQTSSKTATGTVMGTPYYMSPEQIAGKKVDGRADLFSLGVTLYELLTGERPWKGGEAVGTLFFQIASDPYPDPLTIRPDLPKSIAEVLDKALKKKPEERYQTGEEMATAIKTVLAAMAGASSMASKPPLQPANKQATTTAPPVKAPVAGDTPAMKPPIAPPAAAQVLKPAVTAAATQPLNIVLEPQTAPVLPGNAPKADQKIQPPAPKNTVAGNLEKTLPVIYPEEEKK